MQTGIRIFTAPHATVRSLSREKNHKLDMVPPDVPLLDLDTFWLFSLCCACESAVPQLRPQAAQGGLAPASFWVFLTGPAWALSKLFCREADQAVRRLAGCSTVEVRHWLVIRLGESITPTRKYPRSAYCKVTL